MAITFTKDISSTNILFAYNNNIIEFKGNPLKNPTFCKITGSGFDVTLYAITLDGTFFFNFKDYITAKINTRNFYDTLDVDLSVFNIYDGSNGTFLNPTVNITINYDDLTSDMVVKELNFLTIAENLDTWKRNNFYISDFMVLSPLEKLTTNANYIKYFEGYPFDISIYSKTSLDLTIKNLSNGVSNTFDLFPKVSRFFFSDGRTDFSIENIIPFNNGMQILSLNDIHFINLEYESNPCGNGVYIKWLNKVGGGYNYWLFSSINQRVRGTKNIGELENDNLNLDEQFSPVTQIGKKSNDVINVIQEDINEMQLPLLEYILESPKVFYFTGVPLSKSSVNDWVEVSVNTSSSIIKNYKNEPISLNLQFELPERNNITL